MNTRNLNMVVLGASQAGKTALINKLIANKYTEDYFKTEIPSFSLATKTDTTTNEKVCLRIWEVPSQEKFTPIVSTYLSNAVAVILCCEANQLANDTSLKNNIDVIRGVSETLPIFIVLTKGDLVNNEEVNMEVINNLISQNPNCCYVGMTSAKEKEQKDIDNLLMGKISLWFSLQADKKRLIGAFFNMYDKLKERETTPQWFKRTKIEEDRDQETIESLLQNARHQVGLYYYQPTTKRTFLTLGWLDKKGNVTNGAPAPIKEADEALKQNRSLN